MKPALGRRAAVTGIRVVSPAGVGVKDFWEGLSRPAVAQAVRRLPGVRPAVVAVPQGGAHDRPTQMAVAAADWDLADAGLSRIPGRAGPASLPTVAVVSGTSTGGLTTLEVQAEVLPRAGDRQVSPHLVPVAIPDAGAAALSVRYRLRGRASTITTAYAAGTDAGAVGARLVASCAADVVLAGGSDASLTPTLTAGFTTLRP